MTGETAPLHYSILKHFADGGVVDDASGVIAALEPVYGASRMLTRRHVGEALLTAKENGLLVEVRYDLDGDGRLRVFYSSSEYGRDMMARYLPD